MTDPQNKLTDGLQVTLRSMTRQAQVPIIVRYRPERRVLRHRETLRGVREGYHFRLRPFVHMHSYARSDRPVAA